MHANDSSLWRGLANIQDTGKEKIDKATKKKNNRKDRLLFERDKRNSRDLKEIQRGDTIRVNRAILFRKCVSFYANSLVEPMMQSESH